MLGQYFEAESHVSTYNKFRPSPPMNMIEEIVRFTSEKISGPFDLAVDVGCGSGQSTEVYAPFFANVLGIDSSDAIIREARGKCKFPNITYRIAKAENIPVGSESVSLVSVCQSVHWFNTSEFYKEADRVLRKNGVLALYGYQLPIPVVKGAHKSLSTIVRKYYEGVLGKFVLPESRKVYLDNYKNDEFNRIGFVEGGMMKRIDNFVSDVEGTIVDLTGYISSWSTYQNYSKQVGETKAEEILKNFQDEFNSLLDEEMKPTEKFKIRYNYFLLIGRKT
ncbi:UNVERIFIED_CONTAM: hypothetical protein PYX00_006282 [Menopon gallinae]|uniref:Methyltransferase type 11 domain-containing protein n=1 Tax=Menopon gallinae TaxID=328185 RepID=A0AAW2HUK3_9NEOP